MLPVLLPPGRAGLPQCPPLLTLTPLCPEGAYKPLPSSRVPPVTPRFLLPFPGTG